MPPARTKPAGLSRKDLDVMRSLVGTLIPEDGSDTRRRCKSEPGDGGADRKTRQLCGQVARALNLALGESHDRVLQSALVVQVTPDPDASRLRVLLAHPEAEPAEIMAHAEAASAWLRAQVAQAIARKLVPGLVFQPAPPEQV